MTPLARFDLDPANRTVAVGGQAIVLGGRAFDLLATLAAQPGRVFTPPELLAAVWPGRVVEENNLRVQIAVLRHQLGADAIINVARRGYALAPSMPPSRVGPWPAARGGHTLRQADLRAVFHLLGECGELWADPAAWQQHLLAGVSRLIHLPVGLHAEFASFHPGRMPTVVSAVEQGWASEADEAIFRLGHREAGGPFHASPLDLRFRQRLTQQGELTVARAQLMHGRALSRDGFYQRVNRAAHMDEMLYSAVRTGPGDRFHVLIFGGAGHRPTPRDVDLVRLLHRELVPLLGSRLATEQDHSMHGLNPLQRELLALAQTGATLADIAARTALAPAAVGLQLKVLCAHFGVRTRLELMAYLLARRPQPRAPVAPG